ncbi:MAG: hypothetical protein ABIQ01_05615 [Pseudolysinimonas sp.]
MAEGDSIRTPGVWRIRAWIRVGSAVIGVLGLVLAAQLYAERGSGLAVSIFIMFLVVGVPYLAWRPSISLRDSGVLRVRGWTQTRTARARDVADLRMTGFGMLVVFHDGSSFTSVVFQATRHLRYPRVFDFVEALTGQRPPLKTWDPIRAVIGQWSLLRPGSWR